MGVLFHTSFVDRRPGGVCCVGRLPRLGVQLENERSDGGVSIAARGRRWRRRVDHGNDIDVEAVFEWVDTSGVFWSALDGEVLFLAWDDGKPNNFNEEECLEMFAPSRQWFDHSCSALRPFVCDFNQRGDKKSTLNRSQFLSPTSNADSPAPATEPTKNRRTPPPLNAYRSQLHLDISSAKDSSTKDLLADRGTSHSSSSSKNSLLNPESAASTSSSDLLRPSSLIAGAATSISRNYAQTLPVSRSNGGSGKKKKTLADVFLPSDGGGSSSSVSSLEDERSTPANDQRRSLLVEKSERGLFGRRHRRASSADCDPRDAEVVYSSLSAAEGAAATEVTVDRTDDDHRKSSSVSTSTSSSPNKRRSPSPSSSRTSNEGLNVVEFKDDSRQTFFIEHFGLPPEERLLGPEWVYHSELITWDKTNAACKASNCELATVMSEAQNTKMVDFVLENNANETDI